MHLRAVLSVDVGSNGIMATFGLASALVAGSRLRDSRAFVLIAVTVAMASGTAGVMAASFGPVRYDPNGDQLIVTMIYDGTNPDHHFSIQWGPCRKLDQPAHQTIDVASSMISGTMLRRRPIPRSYGYPLPPCPVGQQL